MRKVMLTVLGLVGLSLLLCGSGELLAQTDTTKKTGNTVDADAGDSRPQGMSPGSTGSVASGAGQTAGGTGADVAGLSQSVVELQQEVAQLRQEMAQLRAQLDSVSSNLGVGGSGQAAGGTPPSTPLRAGTAQETGARGTAAQGANDSGEAMVNAIYTGTVRSVSAGQLVLLDEEGKSFTVELGDKTSVLRDGERISASELKQGTRVRATVDMLSGHNQATEVTTLAAQ